MTNVTHTSLFGKYILKGKNESKGVKSRIK